MTVHWHDDECAWCPCDEPAPGREATPLLTGNNPARRRIEAAGREAAVDVEWLPPASGVIEPTDVRVQIPHDPAWAALQQTPPAREQT